MTKMIVNLVYLSSIINPDAVLSRAASMVVTMVVASLKTNIFVKEFTSFLCVRREKKMTKTVMSQHVNSILS